jgi:hypothetical protein
VSNSVSIPDRNISGSLLAQSDIALAQSGDHRAQPVPGKSKGEATNMPLPLSGVDAATFKPKGSLRSIPITLQRNSIAEPEVASNSFHDFTTGVGTVNQKAADGTIKIKEVFYLEIPTQGGTRKY